MDSASKDLYYQKINELLQDEEKIITCISLAAELQVSINDAKVLLTDFVKDSQVKSENVHATFLLSGCLKGSKGVSLHLVKEDDLNEKRTLFETVYTENIYSIQKSKSIDLSIIALVDKSYLESPNNLRGVIASRNSIKRVIKKAEIPQPTNTEQTKESKSFFKKIVPNIINSGKTEVQQSSQDVKSSVGKQPKVKQSSGIANYFTKGSVSAQTNGIHQENNSSKSDGDTSVKNKKSDVTTKKNMASEDKIPVEKENSESEKMEVETVDVVSDKLQAKSSSKKRKKSRKTDDSNNKRRKRIQEICDSDSSDIFEDEQDEDIIERSDEEPEIIPVRAPSPPGKRRIRKTVDEVHMDEEGFLVTTTKYIYESASEGEEEKRAEPISVTEEKPKVLSEKKNGLTELENGVKKQQNKGNKNKKPTTGKQTTLMNFFRRN